MIAVFVGSARNHFRATLGEMGEAVPAELPLIESNLRRWRAIYLWVTAAGAVLTAALGLYLQSGGELKGYVISFAVVGPVLLLIGLVLLVPRLSIRGAPIVRALSEYPERVKVIGLKRTESTVAGAKTAAHSWIVLEIDSRENVELLVRSADVQAVVAEIRRVAPNAKYNPRWDVQRMDVRIR